VAHELVRAVHGEGQHRDEADKEQLRYERPESSEQRDQQDEQDQDCDRHVETSVRSISLCRSPERTDARVTESLPSANNRSLIAAKRRYLDEDDA
jgi:hypothetical protein